jgi:hypothetical protein
MKSERVLRRTHFLIVTEPLWGSCGCSESDISGDACLAPSRGRSLGRIQPNGGSRKWRDSVSARGHRWNCIDLAGLQSPFASVREDLGPWPSLYYCAALMAVCGLLTTTQAAPIMLSLHRIGDDPAALRQAFEGFYRWDSIRAVFGALGYSAEIWALVAILSVPVGNQVPAHQNILSSEKS